MHKFAFINCFQMFFSIIKAKPRKKEKESEAAYITYVTSSAQVHDITCMLKAKNLFKNILEST